MQAIEEIVPNIYQLVLFLHHNRYVAATHKDKIKPRNKGRPIVPGFYLLYDQEVRLRTYN